jgi:hypothetical protein
MGRPPGLVRIRVGFDEEFDDWFELLLLGREGLADLLESTGWSISRIYDTGDANYAAILSKRPTG